MYRFKLYDNILKNRLIAYGCSWTEGEGCDITIESNLSSDELKHFRNQNSWVKLLADKLNISEVINNGISGNSNRKLFNQIIDDVESGKIKKGDFVCIMFSSSLRDYVPFLPNGEWISWSVKHLIQLPTKFYKSYKGKSSKFDVFLQKYKKFFLSNLFSQDYYNYVNQNYIIFLQKLLSEYDIEYIMMDAFENMIQEPVHNDFRYLIDVSSYFGKLEYTLKDYLINSSQPNLWEAGITPLKFLHPNKNGYELIANKLYEFIQTKNLK